MTPPNPDDVKKLSIEERLWLVKTLNELPLSQLIELVKALRTPAGIMPSEQGPQGFQASALLQWVEGPRGPGLKSLLDLLNYQGDAPSAKSPRQELKVSSSLEITIDMPEDTPPEKVREIVKQAALSADAAHRANGGQGLQIDLVEIFEESLVPEGSKR